MSARAGKYACWIALACLVVPMFASYFFDDMFSTISYLFEDPARTQLGWDAAGYGLYASGYSVLCVFGGLVVCGILLDKWGVRITGSVFVGMMVAGAATVLWAITAGFPPQRSLRIAYVGCMFFGLGSEIAGTAVTRSIAKWFRHGPMALAMGLQLAIARLGTACALVLAPRLVVESSHHVYTLAETARPAVFGLGLMAAGLILWALFVAMDARFDKKAGQGSPDQADPDSAFRFADVIAVLKNGNFWLISLLCVLFYSSIIAFKKFAGAILIPRFAIPAETAGWMVSMLPFATVVFAPLFGLLVDRRGRGTRWMVLGSLLALLAHLLLTFAPQGVPFFGYAAMVLLGFGYSLVPAALWPSVPKIVPDKVLGTTFALVYWVQNLGLLSFKMFAGGILGRASSGPDAAQTGAFNVELMFTALCVAAVAVALLFARASRRHPELELDAPNKA
ncbi:MAG: major facilitator superfamily domain-containing protein 1 [Bacteroidales bacterium]|nr:major facilitator superfamily domain-containing protein 1 [Bacteroidales bacterium]